MYRLCNPIDPTIKHEAPTLDALFDFRTNNFPVLQNLLRTSPLQFRKWLMCTITDDNWDLYLKQQMATSYGIDIETNPNHHYYQLTKLLLANYPKWLTEYMRFSLEHTGFCVRFQVPSVDPNSDEVVLFTEYAYLLPYTGYPDDIWNDRDYYTGVANFNEAQAVHAKTVMDGIMDKFNLFYETSPNRHYAMDFEYHTRHGFNSTLIKRSLQVLNDKSCIRYSRQGRDAENIRISTAFSRYNDLSADLKPRASFTATLTGIYLNLEYREPRAPATRAQLSHILNYTTNVLDMLPFNIRGNGEEKAPLYGVELEACSDYAPQEIIAAQQELFFIMKQDGSISGEGRHKYEMVSVPATLKAHKRLWAEFFNKVDYTKFDTSKATGNGMHVHVDRKAFVAKGHLNRFTWFFINPANFDFLFEVSERPTKNDFNRWAPLPQLLERMSKAQVMRDSVAVNRGMRGAVHFKGNSTVEIRMFKGVVSFATVVKNLEFVDSVMQFTAETSLLNVTLPKYLAWLAGQPKNRYQLIREFISQFKDINQVMLANQLKDYLFATSKPETILAKLQKAKFPITNKHLTILNREKRKRTFVLAKDGTVQLAYSNSGKLANLDKSLQAKLTRGTTSIAISLI